jgi:hypothetical protein
VEVGGRQRLEEAGPSRRGGARTGRQSNGNPNWSLLMTVFLTLCPCCRYEVCSVGLRLRAQPPPHLDASTLLCSDEAQRRSDLEKNCASQLKSKTPTPVGDLLAKNKDAHGYCISAGGRADEGGITRCWKASISTSPPILPNASSKNTRPFPLVHSVDAVPLLPMLLYLRMIPLSCLHLCHHEFVPCWIPAAIQKDSGEAT